MTAAITTASILLGTFVAFVVLAHLLAKVIERRARRKAARQLRSRFED